MDIKDFFPSISARAVLTALVAQGLTADVASAITRLVTTNKHVPQGAPTSSIIAQVVATPVIVRIRGLISSTTPGLRAPC